MRLHFFKKIKFHNVANLLIESKKLIETRVCSSLPSLRGHNKLPEDSFSGDLEERNPLLNQLRETSFLKLKSIKFFMSAKGKLFC